MRARLYMCWIYTECVVNHERQHSKLCGLRFWSGPLENCAISSVIFHTRYDAVVYIIYMFNWWRYSTLFIFLCFLLLVYSNGDGYIIIIGWKIVSQTTISSTIKSIHCSDIFKDDEIKSKLREMLGRRIFITQAKKHAYISLLLCLVNSYRIASADFVLADSVLFV